MLLSFILLADVLIQTGALQVMSRACSTPDDVQFSLSVSATEHNILEERREGLFDSACQIIHPRTSRNGECESWCFEVCT